MALIWLIPERLVAELFGVSIRSFKLAFRDTSLITPDLRITNWSKKPVRIEEKDLTRLNNATSPTATYFYRPKTLDAFLRDSSVVKPPTPITIATLVTGTDALLNTAQVGHLLNTNRQTVTRLYLKLLPHFRLGSFLRIPRSAVIALIALLEDDRAVSKNDVALILGAHENTVTIYVRDPACQLQRTAAPTDSNDLYVTRESLHVFLRACLPEYVTPEEWILWRTTHQDELLSVNQLSKRYAEFRGVTAKDILEEKIPCITIGGQTSVPLWATQLWIDKVQPATPDFFAKVFGSEDAIDSWSPQLCHYHGRRRNCPQVRCVQRYIATNRTHEKIDAVDWISAASRNKNAVVTTDHLLQAVDGLTYDDLVRAITNGWISGVWLPPRKGQEKHIAVKTEETYILRGIAERRTRRLEDSPEDGTPVLRYDEFDGL